MHGLEGETKGRKTEDQLVAKRRRKGGESVRDVERKCGLNLFLKIKI